MHRKHLISYPSSPTANLVTLCPPCAAAASKLHKNKPALSSVENTEQAHLPLLPSTKSPLHVAATSVPAAVSAVSTHLPNLSPRVTRDLKESVNNCPHLKQQPPPQQSTAAQ
jgi:hypothetical protein